MRGSRESKVADNGPEITFEDFAQYGGGGGVSPAVGSATRFLGDDFTRPYPVEKSASYHQSSTPQGVSMKRSLFDDDDQSNYALGVRSLSRPAPPDLSKLMQGYSGPPIVTTGSSKVPIVPYDVYAAAETLLAADADGDLRLERSFSAQLQQVVTQMKHQYTSVDPPVLICDSLAPEGPTGYVVYVEEAVPISMLLLALFLRCAYKLPTQHAYVMRAYDQVKMAPFEGRLVNGAQSFALKEQVMRELEQRGFVVEDVLRNVQILMLRIGEISSRDACDGVWLDDVIQQMGRVIKGQHQPAVVAAEQIQ